ncbi:transporter suffix domain-containing protein [Desulfovibrio inopinatus]|uniref:transporter suffix domain-containing protein n=1 Tax=Desulfovibrio inopinatus TaxID=102109 RepID=UPI000429DCDE|nr:transporter suffix domain-containing protein [Desulfovibrio inopinatus]
MKRGWKYYTGIGLLAYSCLPFLLVTILPFLGLSLAESGAFVLTILATGEVAFIGAAALLGKEFIAAIKTKILKIFRRPPLPESESQPISRTRHRAGITLFLLSFLPHYAIIIDLFFFPHTPAELSVLAWLLLVGEAFGIVGLTLLGRSFWDRLNALFQWPGDETKNILP